MIRDYAVLVRLPAVVTVPGDAWAAGGRNVLPSVLLYWAGMAANDVADRELDAIERPERPIPSGRLTTAQALSAASGLTVGGVMAASWSGRRRCGLGVATIVWTYDLWAKNTAIGPLVMSAARGMDVVLGARSPVRGRTAVAAATIAVHTFGVATLSRGEVNGGSRPAGVVFCLAACVAGSLATQRLGTVTGALRRGVFLAALARYAQVAGGAGVRALQSTDAVTVRQSTRTGLLAVTALQAALSVEDSFAAAAVLALAPTLAPVIARSIACDAT